MKRLMLLIISVSLLGSGCTTTERYATTGGLIGATTAGIVGHQYDKGVEGAGIGGVVGTATGVVLGERLKKKKSQYEKGFEDGYLKGQADYARVTWDQSTGKCRNKFTTVTINGVPEGKVDGVIYEPSIEELGGEL